MLLTNLSGITLSLSIASFVTLVFIIIILFRKTKAVSDIFFILFSVFVLIWTVSRLGFEVFNDYNLLLFSSYLLYASAACIPLFLYLFIEAFDKKVFFIKDYILILIPTLIFSVLSFFPGFIISDIDYSGEIRTIVFGFFYIFYFIYIILYFILGIFLIIKKYKKYSGIRKKQLGIILFGILISAIVGVTTNLILPSFGIFNFFWMGPLFSVYVVITISYAILKYNLFNVRLLVSELFVFSIWIFIFIRTIISTELIDQVVNGSLLLLTIIIGFFLVRNINREISQREEIEKLAQKLQKTNEDLKELDKMKTEFLSLATHQIRSPLTSMRGYISMIFEGDYGEVNENLKEPLRVVEKSSEGLIKIVNDFLDVSRIEQGRMKYNLEVCDFRQIVKNIIEEYQPAIEEKGLKIEFEAKEDDYSVKVDENKMEQVMGNLIDNAIKYTIDGEIKVHLFKNDSKTVQLEVSDTGVGIPSEEIKKLFTKFQRAKGAEKTNVTGTGLGIYLAKRITEDHGGTIKVHSDGEGKGAVFTVTLPVV